MGICGIVGIWRRERPTSTREVLGMLSVIRHRGPDDDGMFRDRSFCMGMRRLAVMDVAHGHQPYVSENGQVVAVYNGELYNYPELKRDVESRGHQLTSDADGEVLVHLYEEYGDGMFARMRGMFAVALWDKKRQELLLGRDRVGQKPLYLLDDGVSLAFASEIKAFLALDGYQPEVDPGQLPSYLAHRFVPAPHTLLKHVTKLCPGEAMRIREHGQKIRWTYWEPQLQDPEPGANMGRLADQLDALLSQVVASHLVSDVPLGIFLSGGLDSSLLAAMATKGREAPLEAWSVAFPPHYPGYDEFAWAKRVADGLGLPIHRVEVDMMITPERVRELAFVLDEPMADPTVLPLDGVARAARESETVMLSGEGADEIFSGYAGYGEISSLERLRRVPAPLREFWMKRGYKGAGAFRRLEEPIVDRYRGVGYTFSPDEQQELLKPIWHGSDRPDAVRAYWGEAGQLADLQAMQGFDVRWFLPDDVLLKADRIGMHHNLEVRVPYCDHELVDFALAIPLALRRNRREDKRVLRDVARRYLPKPVVERPKRGFPTPLTSLMGGPLYEIAWDTLLGSRANTRPWFNQRAVGGLLARMGPSASTVARQVYALLMLELWIEELVEDGHRRQNSTSWTTPSVSPREATDAP